MDGSVVNNSLPAFPEDPGLSLGTPVKAHNHVLLQFLGIRFPFLAFKGTRHVCGVHIHIQAKRHTHKIQNLVAHTFNCST